MAYTPPNELLDSHFLRQLERLRLRSGSAFTEREMGNEPSHRHAVNVEFADYREYLPGDDFRSIDWNLAARLDRFFVRLFRAEENLRLELLIDSSTSMHFGTPSKMRHAIQLAAALGYVALRRGDRVSASLFGLTPHSRYADNRGHHAIATLLRFLSSATDSGGTAINASLGQLVHAQRGRGISVLISDLMDQEGFQSGLDTLVRTGRHVVVIHLLTPEEIHPEATGDFEWIDSETQASVEISVDTHTLALYHNMFVHWTDEIRSFCTSRRIAYYQVNTSMSVPDIVLRHLRQGGLLV